MMRQGMLQTNESTRQLHAAAAKLRTGPMCTACQFAKQRGNSTPGTTRQNIHVERNALKTNNLYPGARISVDHFEANPRGRLLFSFGKERTDQKYKGGCIFVDHSSGYIHVEPQVHLNTNETLDAKEAFEDECKRVGVVPQSYITDEGSSFTNVEYQEHLTQFAQIHIRSAPGGHHSNGIAERNISTVMSIARAMLHHSAIHWLDAADPEIWPLAVLHATYILNRIPREDTGRSPLELFSRTTWPMSKFQDFQVWGCPIYVLDGALANGRTLPRWKPRSDRSMYMGNSIKHGHGVPSVLNLCTGKITSQYHVIFDNWFQTVLATPDSPINFNDDAWYKTFGATKWQYVPDNDLPDYTEPVPSQEGMKQLEAVREIRDQHRLQREHDPDPSVLPGRHAPTPLNEPSMQPSVQPQLQR